MTEFLFTAGTRPAAPIHPVCKADLEAELASLPEPASRYAQQCGFAAEPGETLLLPGEGEAPDVLLGFGEAYDDPWAYGAAAESLPEGDYALVPPEGISAERAALCWALGCYQFTRYKTAQRTPPRLAIPEAADLEAVINTAGAVALARDLVNTPAEDMGPDALQAAVEAEGQRFGASVTTITGDALLAENFPVIHAVGRAADIPPRLIDLRWGDPDAPKITLVGKGVCFDSGGLNIKPAKGMRIMKKDMGGAANALAAARMIMGAELPVRLRLLIPAVENAISGNALRPGDVVKSRKGLTIEIDNTDAEGRLVLCDALALASEESPELVVDFATLTGAARVALGPDLAPYYTDDDALSAALERAAVQSDDPVWRMPLHKPYLRLLDSAIADTVNSASSPFAGSVTAALYLSRFVEARSWVHFDIYAWNPDSRPGRPFGGEAQGPRAVFELLKERYGA